MGCFAARIYMNQRCVRLVELQKTVGRPGKCQIVRMLVTPWEIFAHFAAVPRDDGEAVFLTIRTTDSTSGQHALTILNKGDFRRDPLAAGEKGLAFTARLRHPQRIRWIPVFRG